jgi:hypothetical protein
MNHKLGDLSKLGLGDEPPCYPDYERHTEIAKLAAAVEPPNGNGKAKA